MELKEGQTYQLAGAWEGEKKEFKITDLSGTYNIFGELNGGFHVIPKKRKDKAFKGAKLV